VVSIDFSETDYSLQMPTWLSKGLAFCGLTGLALAISSLLFPLVAGSYGAPNPSANTFWIALLATQAVLSLGYMLAAVNPLQHWLLALIGMFLQLTTALATYQSFNQAGSIHWLAWGIIAHNLIWIPLLANVFWTAMKNAHALNTAYRTSEADDPISELLTNTGQRLDQMASKHPLMVVFLRHAGCTFCRQSLADIQKSRAEIEGTGCRLVFVHLGSESDQATVEVFQKYGLDDVPRISDPSSRLYRQFGLELGGFSELFGLGVWLRGLLYGLVYGQGIGAIQGNSFQMPGVYLYHCGVILGGFRHQTAADRPDYVALARQVQQQSELASA
jgi:peroxiredoxin